MTVHHFDGYQERSLWSDFGALHHRIRVSSIVPRLLEAGVPGIESLSQLVSLEYHSLRPDEQGCLYLPWYKEGWLGETSWWAPDSEPYTVEKWVTEKANEDNAHSKKIKAIRSNWEWALKLGFVFIAEDTSLGVRVILDGVHRVCAAFLDGMELETIVLSSRWTHALYPCDFLHHVTRKEKEWANPKLVSV